MKSYFGIYVVAASVLSSSLTWGRIPENEPVYKIKKRAVFGLFSTMGVTPKANREDWFNLDSQNDTVEGVSANAAYSKYQLDPNAQDVLVAVIDSGVDINHEDLQGKIWVNPGESGVDALGRDKATNQVDDDNNGYVDDVYGWNFIGGVDADGKPTHIKEETLEMTRIFKQLSDKKAQGSLTPEEEALFQEVSNAITEERATSTNRIAQVTKVLEKLKTSYDLIKDKVPFTFEELSLELAKAIDESDPLVAEQKAIIVKTFEDIERDSVDILNQILEYHNMVVTVYLNPDFNPRAVIVGDDPNDFNDTHYGNNDVIGPDASHGTHVAGIIAANRNNEIGINGLAQKVKIMVLKVVPDGDERDKDVALSIRYAVDNGAKVINMSFGKAFSPQKEKVKDAIEYATSRGVLIVHAAGNESKDNDVAPNFPNSLLNDGTMAQTWIEVGASAKLKDSDMVADFSNYGKNTVDIFAPGFEIESTIPDNQYASFSGTSMASPTVAGVATMLLGYSPDLSGVEVKDLILNSGRAYPDLEVKLPGTENLVFFSSLSMTGKVANVLLALNNLFN